MAERDDMIISVSVHGVGQAQSDLVALSKTANMTAREISNAFSSIRLGFDNKYGLHNLTKKHSKYGTPVPITSGGSVYQRDIDPSLAFSTLFPSLGTASKTGTHRWNEYQNNLEKAIRIAEFKEMRRKASDGIFTMKDGSELNLSGAGAMLLGWDGEKDWVSELYRQKELREKYNNLSQEQKDYLAERRRLGPNKPTFASDKDNGKRNGIFDLIGSLSLKSFPIIASLWSMNKAIMTVTRTFEMFDSSAKEWFYLFKQSLSSGMSNGYDAKELVSQGNLIRMLGGDAASASAWNAKFATAKAMMAYGGNGGSFMEAARLFGVNVFGSGAMGFATNKEFMENIAKRMGSLDANGKLALAKTVGLNPEQFWAVKDGYDSYKNKLDKASTASTRGGGFFSPGLYDPSASAILEDFVSSFGRLKTLLEESARILSIALLPALTNIIKFVNNIVEVFNNSIGWLFKLIGEYISLTGSGSGVLERITNNPDIGTESTRSAHDEYVRTLDSITNNTKSVNIENVNITTNESLSDYNAAEFGRGIGDGVLNDINVFSGRGIGRFAVA